MRVIKKYKVLSTNLREIFNLPCVKAVLKDDEGNPVLIMKPECLYLGNATTIAFIGDFIEELANNSFMVTRSKLNWLYE
jgi:hypothetical protein